jgi:ABC-type glutathione transport system ATPase component
MELNALGAFSLCTMKARIQFDWVLEWCDLLALLLAGLIVFLVQMVIPTSTLLPFSSSTKRVKEEKETRPPRHESVPSSRRKRRRRISSETSVEREIIGRAKPGIEIPMEELEEGTPPEKAPTRSGLGSPSMPIMLQFKNLSYDVQIPTKKSFFRTEKTSKRLLNGVSGFIAPGQLVAVMGSTGSGKTTLMNVLSGRVRKGVEGEILANGKPRPADFARRVAYVLQDDIFFSFLTVKQTLEYQAQLRLPASMSMDEKKSRANAMIGSMNMRKAANTIIGGPFKRGVSGGERKRVST